ncbi:hypothetical protein NDU88_007171 [Pleurodeles waltl]|uniref:Uncharacterized protein n=1 Tax=Pleurodeles waltl TaxID=8319 RepID=A0AAV7SRR8_PLEWA|nr:hypothetical protein NDU88_007171 [Pleurodeles waltl]
MLWDGTGNLCKHQALKLPSLTRTGKAMMACVLALQNKGSHESGTLVQESLTPEVCSGTSEVGADVLSSCTTRSCGMLVMHRHETRQADIMASVCTGRIGEFVQPGLHSLTALGNHALWLLHGWSLAVTSGQES